MVVPDFNIHVHLHVFQTVEICAIFLISFTSVNMWTRLDTVMYTNCTVYGQSFLVILQVTSEWSSFVNSARHFVVFLYSL